MNVVDLCPVGALTSKDFRFAQRVWFLQTVNSICHGCAKGCNIFIDHNRVKYQDDVIYRFRPRRNDEVNGFFICDEGRLSYKELQENRQEVALLNGEEISEEEAIEEAKTLMEKYKENISVVIDANLYSEEIKAILDFAKEVNASVHSPLDVYIEEGFKDDMLKSAHRAANYKTIEALTIHTAEPESKGLLINFNHPQDFKADAQINFLTHTRDSNGLVFPIAAFSENSGTLTNEDGIIQKCEKAVSRNISVPTVIETLSLLKAQV
jgi:NADH-quinone oxidoreductase subunit G